MYLPDQGTLKQPYANQGQAQANAYNETTAPQSMSDAITSRLQNIRSNFADLCASDNHAAEKIVGSAPTPIAGAALGQIKVEKPPTSFLDGLLQIIAELENIGSVTQEHLNRIHRQF
jgi:hypothetical protein